MFFGSDRSESQESKSTLDYDVKEPNFKDSIFSVINAINSMFFEESKSTLDHGVTEEPNFQDRISSLMMLNEIIYSSCGPFYFPRELKQHIMMLYESAKEWLIEEAYDGIILKEGRLATTIERNGGWSRSNLIYAHEGMKLKFKAMLIEIWFGFAIVKSDCECGIKKGEHDSKNEMLNLFYFFDGFVRGYNPDLKGTKKWDRKNEYDEIKEKSESVKRKDVVKIERDLLSKTIQKNGGKNPLTYYYPAPKMKESYPRNPQENIFELNFKVDQYNNAFVSIISNGVPIHGRFLIPNYFCVIFANYYEDCGIEVLDR